MSTFITPSLSRYQKIILSLIPVAGHEKLTTIVKNACREHFPSALPSVYQGIAIEILRLSKPCNRKIDLRDFFSPCEPFIHDKIIHYLDDESKVHLIEELEKYDDKLNLVTYYKVIERAKERHLSLASGEHKRRLVNDGELMKSTRLVNNLFCNAKQLNYTSDAFISASASPLNTTTDEFISNATKVELFRVGHGLIRLKSTHSGINPKWLLITNHHHKINNNGKEIPNIKLSVERIRETKQSETRYLVDLKVNHEDTRSLDREALELYIEERLAANNENLHEQFEPLKESITSKAYKQWWGSQTQTVTMFCQTTKQNISPLFSLKNSGNSNIFDFLSKDMSVLDSLPNFALPGILKSEDNVSKIGVALIDGEYFIERREEFLSTKLWRKAVVEKSAILLGVFANKFKGADDMTHTPSALPSHVGPEFAVLNHPAAQHIKDETAPINTLFHFSELNTLIEALPKEPDSDAYLPFIRSTATKHCKTKPLTKICNVFGGDLRNEERFMCELPVLIERSRKLNTSEPLNFKSGNATTVNISANGLKLKTSPPFPDFEPGEDIVVSIKLSLGKKTQILARQPYKVVGINKNELRLVYEGAGASSFMADRIISQYIYRNFDELTKNIDHQDDNYVLSEALLNILAHKTADTPFFIMQDKKEWHPSAICINNEIDFEFKNGETLSSLRRFFFSPKIRESYMTALNSLTKENAQATLYLVANLKDQSWGRELKRLAFDSSMHSVLRRMQNQEECRIFKITVSRTPKLISKHIKPELTRLQRINKSLHTELNRELNNTIGVGCIEDVTEEALKLLACHKLLT